MTHTRWCEAWRELTGRGWCNGDWSAWLHCDLTHDL